MCVCVCVRACVRACACVHACAHVRVRMFLFVCACVHLYVNGPAKINHVSTNYTELYFTNIFDSECNILFLYIAEESPLNSAVVMKIMLQ